MTNHRTGTKWFVSAAGLLAISLLLLLLPTTPAADAQQVSGAQITIADLTDDTVTTFSAPEWNISGQIINNSLFVLFSTPGNEAVPNGLAFTAGQPITAPRSYFSGDGTVEARGGGQTICSSDGPFEVLELVTDASGFTTSLAVDFFNPCQGVRGSVRINSSIPLDQGTGFGGRITDELTGQGIAGARVCAIKIGEVDFCSSPSDENGFYALIDIPQDVYSILFFDPEGRYRTECFREVVPCGAGGTKDLDKREFINVNVGINAALGVGCLGRLPTIEGTDQGETIIGTPGDDTIMGYGGDDIIHGNGGNDFICGGMGDDRITTTAGSSVLMGGFGDDVLVAGDSADALWGGSGRDRIRGGDGPDFIEGGSEIDYIWGDGGDDEIFGEGGSDRLRGGPGQDYIEGGSGADRMWGGDDGDELRGQGGQDEMWGGPGDDIMQGNHQSDKMWGGTGNDDIRAAKGKDKLWGEAGNDVMYGGDNSDQMTGGTGTDQLFGGRGSDTCAPDQFDTRQSCAVGIF